MSDFMGQDLGNRLQGTSSANSELLKGLNIKKKGSNMDIDMTDFLTLMITELTNQGIDESVDTSDMINQMVQMQMVTALANMTDASVMGYAASLVGKEVTVAQYDASGNLQELVGTVMGSGTKDGSQVIFLDNDKYYYLNEIMAVGRLPAKKETEDNKTEGTGAAGTPSQTETPNKTEDPDKTENTDKVDDPEGTETDESITTTDDLDEVPAPPAVSDVEDEYHGESGAPD